MNAIEYAKKENIKVAAREYKLSPKLVRGRLKKEAKIKCEVGEGKGKRCQLTGTGRKVKFPPRTETTCLMQTSCFICFGSFPRNG